MIELRNVTKSYVFQSGERRFVFRDLSFKFPDGVNIGLIGRNGAGKSTLMRLLGGIDVPDRGHIVTDKTISWPVGLQGGFNGTLSGRDNVKFVCRIYGSSRAEMQERVRQVEEFAEIGDYFDLPVKSYSSGMRTRVAFGLSMVFPFDYYLIDEVMAVGDAEFKRKSKAALHERLQHSKLILVSHSMQDIAKQCDVVVLLKDHTATLYEDVKAGIRAYQGADPQVRNPGVRQQAGLAGRAQGAAPGKGQGRAPAGPQPRRPAAGAVRPVAAREPGAPASEGRPVISGNPGARAPGGPGRGGAGPGGALGRPPGGSSPQGSRLGQATGDPSTRAASKPGTPPRASLVDVGQRPKAVPGPGGQAPKLQTPQSADAPIARSTGDGTP